MRLRSLLAPTMVVVFATAAWWLAGLITEPEAWASAHVADADSQLARDRDLLDQDIAFFTERAQRDPLSAIDRTSLASRYLQRARETGNDEDNRRAEEAARQSLALRSAHNSHTYTVLASSLLAQHRFDEALTAARELVVVDSSARSARALLGEIYLELGRYDAARAIFGELWSGSRGLATAPRLARWAEISGRLDVARRIFQDAAIQATKLPNLRSEQVAWFYLRLGELELKRGRLRNADRVFRRGLAIRAGDHRLLAALARLELIRRRPSRAIQYGERAIAMVPDPSTFGVIADAYALRGDSANAEDYSRAMDVAVAGQSGPFHRAWSLFLLDHDSRVPEVRARAEEEIKTRRDIYGHDLLAWALYKEGRYRESRRAMTAALALGTEDAMLWYHAGMIERALGNSVSAKLHLERALATNPYFHATEPSLARTTLDSLEREVNGR